MRIFVLICLFASSLGAQDDARALILINNVRAKVMQTVDRLSKYLCIETVDRSTFQSEGDVAGRSCEGLASRKVRKYSSDRLRLDVAVSRDGEIYSWVSQDRFEDRGLEDLVRDGATSTGTFTSFLGAIFESDAATFSFNGDVNTAGRVLAEFGFRVPLAMSKYSIGTKLYHTVVGYDGTFLVDPKTADLVRLTVHADRLPEELHICESTTTLDYERLRLNGSEFLVPRDALLHVAYPDGSELENRTVFSACHEFLGESTLSFDAPPATGEEVAKKVAPGALTLPSGLQFKVALTQAIDTATAAAGDSLQAKLTSSIRDRHNGTLVPKGAAVTARIIRIERHYGERSVSLALALKLEAIEKDGALHPVKAKLESVVKRRQKLASSLVTREDLGSFDQMLDLEHPGVGVLQFQDVTDDYVIKPGLEVEGRTAEAPRVR